MNVSVIIPARNAAATLPETLKSLRAQTWPGWEAVVIDDGSSDSTRRCVEEAATVDARIRVLSQSGGGEAAARNRGIACARFDWLLFLDADDWIEPTHLEKLTAALVADPSRDAAYCDWVRVTPEGVVNDATYSPSPSGVFAAAACFCPFAIHACVVRRELILQIGSFDSSLRTCPDWDLWQRVARAGARFARVSEPLAYYRMRPHSAGLDALQVLEDGWTIIERGHGPDPRVSHPRVEYAEGAPRAGLGAARAYFLCWIAGLLLGRGDSAEWLLARLTDVMGWPLDPSEVANRIFDATLLPGCQIASAWPEIWPRVQDGIATFLIELEARIGTTGLAHQTGKYLVRRILQFAGGTAARSGGRFTVQMPNASIALPST